MPMGQADRIKQVALAALAVFLVSLALCGPGVAMRAAFGEALTAWYPSIVILMLLPPAFRVMRDSLLE